MSKVRTALLILLTVPNHAALQDPLADGVTIHTAATRALQKGTTLDKVIDMVAKVSPTLNAPLVLFTYYNPIIRRGMDKFCQQIKAAGAAGGVRDWTKTGSAGLRSAACLGPSSSSEWPRPAQ
jgi:hypothetical protein